MTAAEFKKLLEADLRRLLQHNPSLAGFRLWSKIVHPRFAPVLLIRISQYFYHSSLLRPLSLFFPLINLILFGIEVTPRCKIGPGLLIPHTSGTVIGAAELGSNVTIFQGVTLGAKFADLDFNPESRPKVGDNVVIGSGAKVLGGFWVRNNAVVASNSLVTEEVPEGALAIGVPAIIKVRS